MKLTSSAIGITRTTTTNGDGEYLAAVLPPGVYDMTVTAKGFKAYQAKKIVVRVAEKGRVDVTLQVGQMTENVVVEGSNVAQVETQSSEISGVVTGKEISQLELNGRNFTQLVTLVPGVSNQTGQDESGVGLNGNISYSINGGRGEYNNWQVDGANNMDTGSNNTLDVFPSLEAVAEFRVQTSNYSATYGRNGSGNIEVITKSGTKSFHGDAYEFIKNDAFNANRFFQQRRRASPGLPTRSTTSATPSAARSLFLAITIPTKRKPSFSGPRNGAASATPSPSTSKSPPAPNAAAISTTFAPATECPVNPATGLPFPGNNVPIDPNAQALMNALIPAPTIDSGANSFFIGSVTEPLTWRQELIRVDHNFNSKLRLMGRYIHDSYSSVDPTVSFCRQSFPLHSNEDRHSGNQLCHSPDGHDHPVTAQRIRL